MDVHIWCTALKKSTALVAKQNQMKLIVLGVISSNSYSVNLLASIMFVLRQQQGANG